nr:phloretin hydrolase [uncultured Holophaga sp.]
MRRELTDSDKAQPYAHWFDRPITPAPAEVYAEVAKSPLDPAIALPVTERDQLLKPGYLPVERGYALMPDGSSFIAGLTKMPGVTTDMLEWWFYWHGLQGFRYAIWDADDHYDVRVSPETIRRRLDPNLSIRERGWNTTDIVLEDVGTGPMLLDISFMSPESFGYSVAAFEKGATGAISANIGLHGETPIGCFSHVARGIEGGIELRSRFWIGHYMADGKPVRVADKMPAGLAEALAKALSTHCPKEYHNLAAILPGVYAENSPIVDRLEDYIK